MQFTPADPISLSLFILFAVVMFKLVIYAVSKTSADWKRFTALFAAYLIVFCIVVASDLPAQYPIPLVPILFVSVLAGAILLAYSKYGTRIAAGFSLAALIGFQSFRLPLELLLHHWAEIGTIPPTMTWTGQNWDIISGVISLLAIPLANKSRSLALAIQAIGFILLLNVLRVVIMSSPFPFSWPLENPIQLIFHLPYALIGPLFVGTALAGHLITFRKLFAK